ncbi:MAG: hypothetical protein ACK481_02835 [Candidatus Melainabacteria bacterium]|jgi:hypothetical protein
MTSSDKALGVAHEVYGIDGLSEGNNLVGTSIKSRKLTGREKPKKALLAFGSEWSRI